MKTKKLDELIEMIQAVYLNAQGDYLMSSMMSIHGLGEIALCERLVDKINILYKTSYELKSDEGYTRHMELMQGGRRW